MKSLMSLTLGALFCIALPCEGKTQAQHKERMEKVYVDPNAIKITPEGIFVIEKGVLTPVDLISKDTKGLFVAKKGMVTCWYCRQIFNRNKNRRCPKCGRLN